MRATKAIVTPVIIFLATITISGCAFYVPPIGSQFTKKKQASVAECTTKDEVIKLLGKPNALENKRFFVYDASHNSGYFFFFIGGGYGGTGGGGAINEKHFSILFEFDDQGIVKRFEIEHAVERIPERKTSPRLFSGRMLGFAAFRAESKLLFGHPTDNIWLNSVAFSPDGRLVETSGIAARNPFSSPKRIWIQDLDNGQLRTIETHSDSSSQIVISPDFTRAALLYYSKNIVTILDLNSGRTLVVFRGHPGFFWNSPGASCLAFDPKSSLVATGDYKGRIKIWDSHTGKVFKSYQGHKGAVVSVAYSLDGRWLATTGQDRTAKLWDARTGQELGAFKGTVGTIRFSPNGDLLAINRGSHVEIWQVNVTSGEKLEALTIQLVDAFLLPYFDSESRLGFEPSLSFSPDGNLLAASHGGVVIYDIPNRRIVLQVVPIGGSFDNDASCTVAFSPDGRVLGIGTTMDVYLWPVRLLAESARKWK